MGLPAKEMLIPEGAARTKRYGPSDFLHKMLSGFLNNLLFRGCGIFRAIQQKAGPLSFLALLLTSIPTGTSPLLLTFFLPKYHFTTCLKFTDIFKIIDYSEQIVFCNFSAEFTKMFILTVTYSVGHILLKIMSEKAVHSMLLLYKESVEGNCLICKV